MIIVYFGLHWWFSSKEPACSAGDVGSVPGSERPPGEGSGNPFSSIFAWEIPWTEEPGGLQSMGSQRARQNLVTKSPPPI